MDRIRSPSRNNAVYSYARTVSKSPKRTNLFVVILVLHLVAVFWTAYLFGYHAFLLDSLKVMLVSESLSHEPPLIQQNGMAACLMVRDDNDLLWEWLAYHYHTLPLRRVIVAADYNSTQDPMDVMQRYSGTSLRYEVWNSTQFMYRFGEIPVPEDDENHHYIHRQRAFITTCTEYMKSKNEKWVAFVDTDEYIAMNLVTRGENLTLLEEENDNATRIRNLKLQQRLSLKGGTVMEALQKASNILELQPCHVMPRLLFSSLENETCVNSMDTRQFISDRGFSLNHTVTVRYVQHAKKGAFYPSKWGKVLVDVSRLSDSTLAVKPKNSHRPFQICPKPLVEFDEALLKVNHYLGSWERYNARKDARRSRAAFEERAYFQNGIDCDTHQWFMRFVDTVGIDRAKWLLGVDVKKSF